MAEKDKINVKITDKEEKETENNVDDEKMEGKENKEGGEKEKGEVKEETPEKNESTFNRFFGWFKSKPKKEEEHGEEKENKEEIKENENKKELITSEDSNEVKKVEKRGKDIETLKIKEDTKDVPNTILENKETLPDSSDRTLLIIEEEGKTDRKLAPLAQAEDEDCDEPSESRPSIDRPVIEPKSADAVQAERETTENKALSQDDTDAKAEKRKSATVFLHLSQPRFEHHSQESADRQKHDKASEHDESYQSIEQDNKLVAAQHAAPIKDNQQESKMEEVIEEKRHDARTESMQQTWKTMEELEPNKTYRVSYTVTTTTVDKSSKPKDKSDDDDDDNDDDENERLFGEHVLLSNDEQSKPKYDGPPPQDLEPELTYEEAKKDEAGTADIDKIFAMMAKDGPTPEDGGTLESTRRDNGSQEILETPEDIFRKLHNWDKEPTDWWTSTKKKRDYEEWMKPMKEGTIRRVIIPKVEIPYDACVRFVTDWKYREEWDKTFSEIKILKDSKDSKLIYCPVKKRDLAFEMLDRKEDDPPSYIMTWKRQMVDKDGQEVEVSEENKKQLQLITHTCGIILRPSESGEQATYITILCQLEGEVDKALKNTYLAGHPKSWLRNLNKYYKKQQKGSKKKVVYL